MFDRRDRIDPETARLIEQRLENLLVEAPDSATTAREDGASPRRVRREELDDRWPPAREDQRGEDDAGPEGIAAALRNRWRAAVLSRTHLGVLAVLAVTALLASGWLVLRARPVAVATPITIPSTTAAEVPTGAVRTPSAPNPSGSTPSPSPTLMSVHVLGAVRRPGVVELAAPARVEDALRAAGGLARRADPDRLNLAAPVADGQQIYVGTEDEPAGEVRSGLGSSAGSSGTDDAGSVTGSPGAGGTVDLNSATVAQLEELPGVGPVTAAKIVAWRTEHGRFTRVEELQEVAGIGPKTYAEIAPHCRV